jgi:hypothetical protein
LEETSWPRARCWAGVAPRSFNGPAAIDALRRGGVAARLTCCPKASKRPVKHRRKRWCLKRKRNTRAGVAEFASLHAHMGHGARLATKGGDQPRRKEDRRQRFAEKRAAAMPLHLVSLWTHFSSTRMASCDKALSAPSNLVLTSEPPQIAELATPEAKASGANVPRFILRAGSGSLLRSFGPEKQARTCGRAQLECACIANERCQDVALAVCVYALW